jgi:hypothetical protein
MSHRFDFNITKTENGQALYIRSCLRFPKEIKEDKGTCKCVNCIFMGMQCGLGENAMFYKDSGVRCFFCLFSPPRTQSKDLIFLFWRNFSEMDSILCLLLYSPNALNFIRRFPYALIFILRIRRWVFFSRNLYFSYALIFKLRLLLVHIFLFSYCAYFHSGHKLPILILGYLRKKNEKLL